MDAAAKPPLQFGVRHLLLATTVVALVAGAGSLFGPGASMLTCGALAALANASGRLRRWQSGAWPARWTWTGWLLLLASLVSPALRGCGDEAIPGWKAGAIAVSFQAESLGKVVANAGERRETLEAAPRFLAAQTFLAAINVGNLLLLVSPLALWLWRRGRGAGLNGLLVVAAACACAFGCSDSNGFLVGYYLWCAALLAVMGAVRIRWTWLGCAAVVASVGVWALRSPAG